jgi:hypothetical protein
MILSPLYHYSPAERYGLIRAQGLRPGQQPTVSSCAQQHVCMSPDPRLAWKISGAMSWVSDIEQWDLWQVWLIDSDEVHVREEYGPVINEVMVRSIIPPSRIWWIGRRYDLGLPPEQVMADALEN